MYPGGAMNGVRKGVLNGIALCSLLLGVAGCKTYKTGPLNPPGFDDDAAFEAPSSGRQVVTEGGLVGTTDGSGSGGSGGFGVGSSGSDARPDGWQPVYDAYQPVYDAYQPPANDGGGGCMACDLLAQNCPGRSACYRSGGEACCSDLSQVLVPEGGVCADDPQCDKGLLCVDSLCVAICDVNAPRCGPACKPIGRYANVGYCAP
jgi:hypothetical protein